MKLFVGIQYNPLNGTGTCRELMPDTAGILAFSCTFHNVRLNYALRKDVGVSLDEVGLVRSIFQGLYKFKLIK